MENGVGMVVLNAEPCGTVPCEAAGWIARGHGSLDCARGPRIAGVVHSYVQHGVACDYQIARHAAGGPDVYWDAA